MAAPTTFRAILIIFRGTPELVLAILLIMITGLGIVGGSGIGFYLTNTSTVMTLHGQVTVLVTMVFITVLLIEGISAWMRRVFK